MFKITQDVEETSCIEQLGKKLIDLKNIKKLV